MRKVYIQLLILSFVLACGTFGLFSFIHATDRDASEVEILKHEWHSAEVWERIGKTQFVWKAVVHNRSDLPKRVFVYYDLLDARDFPLAQNVANQWIDPHQTAEITSDSYINTDFLPKVKNSRATLKVGFPE